MSNGNAGVDRALADWKECTRLEAVLLSDEERAVINDHVEQRRPRWDLNPPQRESYDSPHGYVLGLRAYARRVIASTLHQSKRGEGTSR